MPTAPTQYTVVTGTAGDYAAVAFKDANGGIATVTTPWYINASGILIPQSLDSNGVPQTSLSGSNVTGPTLLESVAYSAIPAQGSYHYGQYTSKLSRNAVRRAVIVFNGTDQPIQIPQNGIVVYDSIASTTNIASPGGLATAQTIGTNAVGVFAYSNIQEMNAPIDSIMVAIGWSTAAQGTTGDVQTWITETFGA